MLGTSEIIIIILVVVLLFGAKKLPEAARSLGRSMRIFKSEVKEMSSDGEDKTQAAASAPQAIEQRPASAQPQSFWDRPENQPQASPLDKPTSTQN